MGKLKKSISDFFGNLKKKIVRSWERTKYTTARAVITQIALLLLAGSQCFLTTVLIMLCVDTLPNDGGSAIVGIIAVLLFGFGTAILTALLRGDGKPEADLPDCYYINWDAVSDEYLSIANSHMAKRYSYVVHNVNPKTNRIECIRNINKISWELDDSLRGELNQLFRSNHITVSKDRDNFWKWSLIRLACMPIALPCEIISTCVLATSQWASRNVVSSLSGLPFSMKQLPKKQRANRFFFNAVEIGDFETRAWLGQFDVRK